MTAAARSIVLALLGLILLSGCGNDDSDKDADSPSTPVVTSQATPESTSSADPAEDPISVTVYDADFTVTAAGDLAVVETLTLDVPVDDRHGIFRTFGPSVPVADFTATLDGRPTPVSETTEGDATVFKVGDPDQTLAVGEHSVRMEYGVADVLTREAAGTRLDWLLIPSDWALDIRASELTVELPDEAAEAECTIGDVLPCDVRGVGTRTLVVKTRELGDHTAVRLRVLLPSP